MTCWCFALTSRSFTTNTTNDAGMEENAIMIMSDAVNESAMASTRSCLAVRGSGLLVTRMYAAGAALSSCSCAEWTCDTASGAPWTELLFSITATSHAGP